MNEDPAVAVDVAARLGAVRADIARAAGAAGRPADAVRLVAVSKYHSMAAIEAAHAAGQVDFGENYAQELAEKAAALAARGVRPTWHFMGRLQRNKVTSVVAWAQVIHSVDSVRLAEAISRAVCARATGEGPPAKMAILLQVNFDAETQKGGVQPAEVVALAEAVDALPGLALWGLMAVPPDTRSTDEGSKAPDTAALGYFTQLARLQDAVHKAVGGRTKRQLSMGMSHDFASAIGVGATLVRIGTAIFGPRPRHRSAP